MGCTTCDINKVINLNALEKKIILVLNAFKKKSSAQIPFAPYSLGARAGHGQGTGRAGDLRARKGTAIGAGSPGHVMKQDKLSSTCKE